MNNQQFTQRIVIMSIVLIFAGMAIFLLFPQIDIWVSSLLFDDSKGFLFRRYRWIYNLRQNLISAYTIWYVMISAYTVYEIFKQRGKPLAPTGLLPLPGLYLVVASITGPLLIANALLKNNWGRARPRDVVEFGGSLQFTPPGMISDQCLSNCSFVSGEPSAMFMIFAALAFIWPAKRILMLVLMVVLGSLSGLMRIGQGAHFFSDVVFAGLFMILVAALLYWAMFLWPRKRTR